MMLRTKWWLIFAACQIPGLAVVLALVASQPTPQLVLPCKVVHVHDGDTATCEVTLRMSVRLLDCWADELKEPWGPAAKAKLAALAEGRDGLLSIPLGNDVGDSLTFGRVLGRISIGGKDVSEEMVRSGFATKEKRK